MTRRILGLTAVGLLLALGGNGAEERVDPVAYRQQIEADWLRQVELRHPLRTSDDALGAVDGVKDGHWNFHTAQEENPWWHVDLGKRYRIGRIVVYNRNDGGCIARAYGMVMLASDDGKSWTEFFRHTDEPFGGKNDGRPLVVDLSEKPVEARWIRMMLPQKSQSFHLDEVEIYPVDAPETNVALLKPADQSSAG